jgi:alkanesulfonate monooxygenase SsuD/methylene tetrahydromethanopterin reductase-like flavin-dependent oxidoreductase (luciferase family)
MKFGVILFGGSDEEKITMAQEAEAAGWDSIFLADEWGASFIYLTAMAQHTTRIRLGTMLTPLPLHLPWVIAAQTAILDRLSHGRLLLAVGLGVLELDKVNLPDNAVRAQMLDEGLDILSTWWSGVSQRELTYEGRHYHLTRFQEDVPWLTHTPAQQPRIPIWVVGGEKNSQMRRAARWDGAMMQGTPDEIRQRIDLIQARRTLTTPLDIITEGSTLDKDPDEACAIVQPFADAGVTWWLESNWNEEKQVEFRKRINAGPPRVK